MIETQRIDQWLWHARLFKTRTLAGKFVSDGRVRVTRDETPMRVEKASFTIRPGDHLVFTLHDRLRILGVIQCAKRRGPASEAQTLYDDQSPPPPPKEKKPVTPFAREKGAGRPTKKDRRALDAVKAGTE